jgi:hypothetical protein
MSKTTPPPDEDFVELTELIVLTLQEYDSRDSQAAYLSALIASIRNDRKKTAYNELLRLYAEFLMNSLGEIMYSDSNPAPTYHDFIRQEHSQP